MIIQDESLGRIEVTTVPTPSDFKISDGTYTASGRVLIGGRYESDPDEKDWYRIITLNDDGTDICSVFAGVIPQKRTANGVRWMCFTDNTRLLLGDYILECTPDLDRCESSVLVPLEYPEEILNVPGLFAHWSEIIISPDCEHMCWTTLQMTGSGCYLGKLVRGEESYHLEDVCMVSNTQSHLPDPDRPGYSIPQPSRGGEVKQFVHGGRAISEAGAGNSLTDGLIQSLDSEEVTLVTDTPGYEETSMLSPDETLAVVMSPRFSDRSNCAVFGLIPHPHSMAILSMMNVAYMYAIAGVRAFRKGNIGPALIEVDKSMALGRDYKGVNLSDPEGKWVYASPISWTPDSTKAMWNERTRPSEGEVKQRLQVAHLLDKAPAAPVPNAGTPASSEIPYAVPIGTPVTQPGYPIKVAGKYSGELVDTFTLEDGISTATSTYTNFSDDGKSFTDGGFTVKTPVNMFVGGRTFYEGKMTIHGEHNGQMDLHAVFERATAASPSMLIFEEGEDGLPMSRGYATYDGVTLRVEDMEP